MTTQEKYLKNPDQCPFCDSHEIEAGWANFEHIYAYRKVKCNDCGKVWTEKFKMVSVDFENDD